MKVYHGDFNRVFRELCLDGLDAHIVRSVGHAGQDGEVIERYSLGPVVLSIDGSYFPLVLSRARRPNIRAAVAELIWTFTGSDDIDWLKRFIPQAGKWSDDGWRWRGAYGNRLKWQMPLLMQILRDDPHGNRAAFAVHNGENDLLWALRNSPDVPCNLSGQLRREGDRMHYHGFIRSNDLIWGLSHINVLEWWFLVWIACAHTDSRIGSVNLYISDLHYYPRHRDLLYRIVSEPVMDDIPLSVCEEDYMASMRWPIVLESLWKLRNGTYGGGERLLEVFGALLDDGDPPKWIRDTAWWIAHEIYRRKEV